LNLTALPQPHIAVLLAAYNGTQWLPEQLESIFNQVGVEVTVYASVDKSTDGTFEWLSELSRSNPRLKVLPYGEVFGGAAKNFFRLLRDVDLQPFDAVAFADQDDIWLPEKLSSAHRCLATQGVDGYSSSVTAFWADGRRAPVEKSQPQRRWDYYFEAAGPGCSYLLSALLAAAVKRCVVDSQARVDDVALHDWFCYAFARANGYRWFIDPTPSLLYRQHANNQFGVNSGSKAFQSRTGQILNGWWLGQVSLIASLVGAHDLPAVQRLPTSYRRALFSLSWSAWQCRRRWRDQVFFFFLCWVLMLRGPRHG
jgi:rhamnosyltransferase